MILKIRMVCQEEITGITGRKTLSKLVALCIWALAQVMIKLNFGLEIGPNQL